MTQPRAHPFTLAQHAVDRAIARRGSPHFFDRFEPARTAMLVIDMQDCFCAPGGVIEVPMTRAVVPTINRLANAMRGAGATVVWVTMALPDDARETWSSFLRNFLAPELQDRAMAAIGPGGDQLGLWRELEPAPVDWQVRKNRYSAFIEGASELEPRLRASGIDTLVITGTLTQVCCESTARDAMMRNFDVAMVSDANAAPTDADHAASLNALYQNFADVFTADEVVARLAPGGARAAE